MRKAALSDKIFSLFLHNVKSSGHSDVIIPLRTWSHVAARFFRTDLFDMVFIDGDHAYSSVARDIRDYAPLVMDGGYICGDDLELQMSEIDRNFARTHLDDDFVCDPSTGTNFHPGVTMAVGEFFGEVSAYAGFWVMQKTGGTWRKVALH
jgi:predicted O-methyltransferase YrrM